jgi:hypothetical protein
MDKSLLSMILCAGAIISLSLGASLLSLGILLGWIGLITAGAVMLIAQFPMLVAFIVLVLPEVNSDDRVAPGYEL